MKYIKAIDIWENGEKVRNGELKLQSGQWIRIGPGGQLSKFESVTRSNGIIRAFHGPTPGIAQERYLDYVFSKK